MQSQPSLARKLATILTIALLANLTFASYEFASNYNQASQAPEGAGFTWQISAWEKITSAGSTALSTFTIFPLILSICAITLFLWYFLLNRLAEFLHVIRNKKE